MITVEGYKMFRGALVLKPGGHSDIVRIEGEFLYKPEYDCWYGNGSSYPSSLIELIEDEDDKKRGHI